MRVADREAGFHSCLYHGQVTHTRHVPFRHSFQYRLFMVYLDLSELDAVFRRRWFWSARRPNVAWFRRADHLGRPDQSLDSCVRQIVRERSGGEVCGPIRLLTHLRHFGVRMNPVCFYFCYDSSGRKVEAIVAEVTNTPWGEQHCYVIRGEGRESDALTARHPKQFHVSPFLPMDLEYRWRVTMPGETLQVQIADYRAERRVFEATLSLRRRPMSSIALARALLRHPLMTARVSTAIYWQALRLRWRGAKFHRHPRSIDPTHYQRLDGSTSKSVSEHIIEETVAS